MAKNQRHERFGRWLLKRRKQLKMSQQKLADEISRTQGRVSSWEKGNGLPEDDVLAALATTLQVTQDELITIRDGSPLTSEEESNILPLLEVVVASQCDKVTVEDIVFLATVQSGLPQLMAKSLVEELLRQRHG